MNTQLLETPPGIIYQAPGESSKERSNYVRLELETLRANQQQTTFEMADLLVETHEKNYWADWGFQSFAHYVQESLDIKERQAYYLIQIVTVSRKLNIDRDEIEGIAISKLKEIFSLDPEGFYYNAETSEKEPLDAHIIRLTGLAPNVGLDAIKAEVRRLKGLPEKPGTWRNLYFEDPAMAETWDRAIELVKRHSGNGKEDPITGQIRDISDATAAERMAADILSDPNWQVEEE